MIALLFIILLILEIFISVFIIVKLNKLKYCVTEINNQLYSADIEQISKNIRASVSTTKNFIVNFIRIKELQEKEQNIKTIINIIIAVVSMLKHRKIKHK